MSPFGTIIADPPWPYQRASKKHINASGYVAQGELTQYNTMSIEDICSLPVESISANNSVLLLWTTPAFCASGDDKRVCEAWGFRPVTYTYWIKTTKNGCLHYGVGYWFRGVVEPILIGVKGKSYRTNERGAFMHSHLGHSTKPDTLHELAEKHFPPPRFEMFARRTREGWTTIGYEIDGKNICDYF